jgi:hypothetical protein
VNERQALEAAEQIGIAEGDHIFLQSEGQIENPHLHAGQTSGEAHVDGWRVENRGGLLVAEKIHSDD